MKIWGTIVVQATKCDGDCDAFKVVSIPKSVVSPKEGDVIDLDSVRRIVASYWVVTILPAEESE